MVYSLDENCHNYTIIIDNCAYPPVSREDFHNDSLPALLDSTKITVIKPLPDSSLRQILRSVSTDSGKVFDWDKNHIHAPHNISFLNPAEIDLLFDTYSKWDTSTLPSHKDSIQKRLIRIDSIRKLYNTPNGVYVFYAPVFDSTYRRISS